MPSTANVPNNLPRSGAIAFVGRDQKLTELDNKLQRNDRIAITAVQGMGGIGKTELALQYAIAALSKSSYPGGVCWLRSRDQQIATQIVSFAKANLGLSIPDDMEASEQVAFTWQHWPAGNTLIMIDDVADYDTIAPYLPPPDPRFKVLITTRQNFGSAVTAINIEELSDTDAIALLKSIVGEERIESQHSDVEILCQWVGNLPLGLELLGRFLAGKPDWAIAKLIERLDSKRLAAKALIESKTGMTATLGIAAALELSWAELSKSQQDLARLLGMFAVAPIPWNLVELCFPEIDPDDLENMRDEALRDRSLIKRVGEGSYQLHQVVQEFFRAQLAAKHGPTLQSAFCKMIVAQAKHLDDSPTREQIEQIQGVILHLEATALEWVELLAEEELIWPFVGIGRFYEGQGSYGLAEHWRKNCLETVNRVLGDEHPHVASSLNNLAGLYDNQGRYKEAEPLYLDALALRKRVLGDEHPHVASSLNNLAGLYDNQGRYEEAEPLYLDALALRKRVLGDEHPHVASSLNDLAALYYNQGRYKEAEPLYLDALALRKRVLGDEHPDVASSLNNLALLYRSQGRYEEAEPLYLDALALWKRALSDEHPYVATSLNNLAALYDNQGHYEEAELLYLDALALRKRVLGDEHPHVAGSYFNLGVLYDQQGQYQKAKSLYLSALKIYDRRLGQNHPKTQALLSQLNALPPDTEALPLEDLGL